MQPLVVSKTNLCQENRQVACVFTKTWRRQARTRKGQGKGNLAIYRLGYRLGARRLVDGRDKAAPNIRRCKELERQLEERDRVIGELTIANRILKENGGWLILDDLVR